MQVSPAAPNQIVTHHAVCRYKKRCQELVKYLEGSHKTVLPENRKALKKYLGDDTLGDVSVVVDSLYTDSLKHFARFDTSNERLRAIRSERMEWEIARLKNHLEKPKYQIDSPTTVDAICGNQQIEQVCPDCI